MLSFPDVNVSFIVLSNPLLAYLFFPNFPTTLSLVSTSLVNMKYLFYRRPRPARVERLSRVSYDVLYYNDSIVSAAASASFASIHRTAVDEEPTVPVMKESVARIIFSTILDYSFAAY